MNISDYNRVMVIGNNGSGKSYLSKALAEITGLPLIHLDAHFWRPDWEMPTRAQWLERNREFIAGETWILDGMCSHGGTMALRFAAADLAIFLDVNRFVCLAGLLKRHGKPRADTAIHAWEKWDLRFFGFCAALLLHSTARRRKLLALHETCPDTPFFVIKGRREMHRLIKQWRAGK